MPDVDDEDAFDRALRLEDEIRSRVDAGDIDEAEAAALRDLAGASDAGGVRLSIDQAVRVVEEGVDPAVLVAMVRTLPRIDVDEAIDLIGSYAPEPSWIRAVADAGLSDLDADDVEELWANDIQPDTVRLVAQLGLTPPVDVAVELTHHLDDPAGTLRELAALELSDLTVEQVCELADHGISPTALRQMLDANPELTVDDAIVVASLGLDADALADFAAKGITIDSLREGRDRSTASGIHVDFPRGGRRVIVGMGNQTIRKDETVTGFYLGNVTILPGVAAVVEATIIGDVHVLAGATLDLRGRVIGTIRNRGGTVVRPSTVEV